MNYVYAFNPSTSLQLARHLAQRRHTLDSGIGTEIGTDGSAEGSLSAAALEQALYTWRAQLDAADGQAGALLDSVASFLGALLAEDSSLAHRLGEV